MPEAQARASRLTHAMTFEDGIAMLSGGNPGAVVVLRATFKHHFPAGMAFVVDLDGAGLSGEQIYLLAQFTGSPLRAAALLHSCMQHQLPTLDELRRDLKICERDRTHPLSPLLETAITVIGEQAYPFRGADLRQPGEH